MRGRDLLNGADVLWSSADPELSYMANDAQEMIDDATFMSTPWQVVKVHGSKQVATAFLANVPTSFVDGEPDEWEVAVFATEEEARAAQGMSASGQDPQGLGATPASPVAESDAPTPNPEQNQ